MNLIDLNLSDNKITDLNSNLFCNFKELKSLDLSHNESLGVFPDLPEDLFRTLIKLNLIKTGIPGRSICYEGKKSISKLKIFVDCRKLYLEIVNVLEKMDLIKSNVADINILVYLKEKRDLLIKSTSIAELEFVFKSHEEIKKHMMHLKTFYSLN